MNGRLKGLGLLVPVACLLGLGLCFIYSASCVIVGDGEGRQVILSSFVRKQVIWIAVGCAALVAASRIDVRHIERFAYPVYGAVLFMLLWLLVFGEEIANVKRWIRLGPVNLQPSELAKVALNLGLARLLVDLGGIRRLSLYVLPVGLTGMLLLPIMMEPDLGTSLLLIPVLGAQLWVMRARPGHMAILGLAGVALALVAWLGFMHDYQRARIMVCFAPEANRQQKEYYQLEQSLIAIGSGKAFGRDYLAGNYHRKVPEHHTDFIVTVVAEEFGLSGVLLVMALYVLLFVRMTAVAVNATTRFGRLLVFGLMAGMAAQVLINLSMAVGLMPVTGMTLPFLSYGGSSLVVSMLVIGLVLNVARQKRPRYFAEPEW